LPRNVRPEEVEIRTPPGSLRENGFFQADAFPYTRSGTDVHLIDGTYELFRHFYAAPAVAAE